MPFLLCSLAYFGEGNGTPLQYSRLENPVDGGAWWAAVHGVAESGTWLRDFTFTFHFHTLEKEMTTHSGVLAWRVPGTGKPGGLRSMGSQSRTGLKWLSSSSSSISLFSEYLVLYAAFLHSGNSFQFKNIFFLWGILMLSSMNFFYWSIIVLQCCVNFYLYRKWISYMYTYIPSLLDLSPMPTIPSI